MFLFSDFPKWIRPTVFSFLPVRWYAIMYLVAFSIAYCLFRYQCRVEKKLNSMNADKSLDGFLYVIIGLILGARLFSTLFYEGNFYYWTHPWMIFWPFRNGSFVGLPGMSYHGGVVGGIIGGIIFSRREKIRFWEFADVIFTSVPLGYTFGRLGNFINGELWGRCTGSSYGMIFPDAPWFSTTIDWVREAADKAGITYALGDYVNLPRHPSQLYEAAFEGIFLFLVIWFICKPVSMRKKNAPGPGFMSGCYILGYGIIRFVIEYFREPDSQLGFIFAWGKETEPTALFKSIFNISLGQCLCALMVASGAILVYLSIRKRGNNK